MDENLERIDTMLNELYEKVDSVKTGSEEFERLFNAIEKLENARSKVVETMSEAEVKEKQTKFNWYNVGISIAGAIVVPLIAIAVQRKTNIDLFEFEKSDVMTHRGFENNPLRLLANFRK